MVGRLPGSPRPAGSGRRKGSLDKQQRALITEQVAKDLLTVYRKLGGVKWLLEWAKANETEFIRQGLARLMPAFPRPEGDPDVQVNQQFNIDSGNSIDIARRIAFALSMGADALGQGDAVIAERVPYVQLSPEPAEPVPAPAPDPAREEWARQAAMTQEQRLAAEDAEQHINRKAFAAPRPAWMPAEERPRPRVGVPRSKRDLL